MFAAFTSAYIVKQASGSWVEFTDGYGATTRARWSWISKESGRYMFTDRKGAKVAGSTPLGLAVEFRRGTARIVEKVRLFDRALSRLTDHLHASTHQG